MSSPIPKPDYRVYEGNRRVPASFATKPALLPENAAQPTTGLPGRPDIGAPATDWNDRLAATGTAEFSALFHEAVTEGFGAVARSHGSR